MHNGIGLTKRKTMDVIFEKVLPPKTGLALELETGQNLRVIDLEGQQVVDMALFNKETRAKSSPPPIRGPVMCRSRVRNMFRAIR